MVASLDSELTVGVDIREWRRGTSTGIGRVLTSYLSWAAKHTAHHHVLVGNEQSEVRADGDFTVCSYAGTPRATPSLGTTSSWLEP